MEEKEGQMEQKPVPNTATASSTSVNLKDYFTKDAIRAGVVSGLILAVLGFVGSILGDTLGMIISLVVGVLTVVLGMSVAYAKELKQDKLADALKVAVPAGLIAGAVAGLASGIASILYLSNAYRSIYAFYQPPYFQNFFNAFIVNGVLVTGAVFIAGVLAGIFLPKTSLPKEIGELFSKIGKLLSGK